MRSLRFALAFPFLFTLAGCPRNKTDDDGKSLTRTKTNSNPSLGHSLGKTLLCRLRHQVEHQSNNRVDRDQLHSFKPIRLAIAANLCTDNHGH